MGFIINNYGPSTQIDNHDNGVVNITNGQASKGEETILTPIDVTEEVREDNPIDLPSEVADWIRNNPQASIAFDSAIKGLKVIMGKGSNDACWNHVKQVLEDKNLVPPLTKTAFAKVIHAIDTNISLNSVQAALSRKTYDYDDGANGRINVQAYSRWSDSNPDKAICEKVANHFCAVVSLRPKG